MLGLEGIPGIYIHSLLATENDDDRVAHTQRWRDLISGQRYEDLLSEFGLEPYQTLWITNR